MAVEFHPRTIELPIRDIADRQDRLRPVSEATVAVLVQVIEEHGFTVPVLVRKTRKGFVLIDGAHRLAAMTRMGRDAIPVVAVSCTDDEARALESSQNLAGASLSPLDDAVFLAAYSAAYERLHPETRRGVAGALSRWDATELSSFAETIAEKRAISVRQVRKIAAAGRAITREEANQLRAAPVKVTLADLIEIGKIGEPDERAQVVLKLASGEARRAAKARRQWRAEQGLSKPVEDRVEGDLKVLKAAWARASKETRWRFLRQHGAEVEALLHEGVMGHGETPKA